MNKYQEALNVVKKINLRSEYYVQFEENNIENVYEEEINILQELVNKETPMLVTDIHVDEFYCPKCYSEISHDKYNSEHPKYCEECGQRLDWSDSK